MASSVADYLVELFEDHVRTLPGVSRRMMFGCAAFFRGATMFGVIWKRERIALKFPDAASHEAALALPGAEPWTIGAKTMGRWVLVPESFHDDDEALRAAIVRAHGEATARPGDPVRRRRAPAAKLTSRRTTRRSPRARASRA